MTIVKNHQLTDKFNRKVNGVILALIHNGQKPIKSRAEFDTVVLRVLNALGYKDKAAIEKDGKGAYKSITLKIATIFTSDAFIDNFKSFCKKARIKPFALKKQVSYKVNPGVVFVQYDKDKLKKDIKKALKRYEELHFTRPSQVRKAKIRLPKIITKDGKEVDLEKKFPGARLVMTQVGVVIGIVYAQEKNNGKYGMFLHILRNPKPALTNDDGTSLYIAEDGGVMVDETGVVV